MSIFNISIDEEPDASYWLSKYQMELQEAEHRGDGKLAKQIKNKISKLKANSPDSAWQAQEVTEKANESASKY